MDMKELRQRAGLRTVDVASRLGRGEATVRNWDSGKTVPTLEIIELPAFLDTYKCTLEELIEAAKEGRQAYEATQGKSSTEEPKARRSRKRNLK